MARTVQDKAYEADMNSADVDTLVDLVDAWAKANPELTDRRIIPLSDEPNALAQHRLQSNAIGSAVQWVQTGPDKKPELRIMEVDQNGQLQVGDPLRKRNNLARQAREPDRRRFALDLNTLIPDFYDMTEKQGIKKAQDKYAYINHRGYEAHHILPIGLMGTVKQGLDDLGIFFPARNEMLLRKMYMGDAKGNLSMVESHPNKERPGIETLQKLPPSMYDEHTLVHSAGEQALNRSGLPYTENQILRYMQDPNHTNLSKQSLAVAVAQAHRLGLQNQKLGIPNENSVNMTNARKERYITEQSQLNAYIDRTKTKNTLLTQQILSDLFGKKAAHKAMVNFVTPMEEVAIQPTEDQRIDVGKSLRTYANRR